ncbi:MAG: hypothetical protein WD075_08675 [Rhodospirillales bacterium]
MPDAEIKITWKGRLLALLIGLLVLVIASEGVIRIVYPTWDEFFAGRFMTIEHVPEYGDVAVGRKGFDGYFSQNNGDFRARIRINAFGLRNDEPVTAADGKVWVIGDSMAFGWGVEATETYTAVISDALGAPAYNIASPGTNVCGYQALAGRIPADNKPRAVIVGLILENDLMQYDCTRYANKPARQQNPDLFSLGTLKITLTEHSALYNFFTVAMKRVDIIREALIALGVVNKSHAYRNQLDGLDVERITKSTAAELQRLKAMFDPATPFAVMIAPARFEIANDDPKFKIIRQSMVSALQHHGIAYIDPIDAFRAAGFKDTHFVHDGHWSANGHRIAGTAIADWLRSNAPLN